MVGAVVRFRRCRTFAADARHGSAGLSGPGRERAAGRDRILERACGLGLQVRVSTARLAMVERARPDAAR